MGQHFDLIPSVRESRGLGTFPAQRLTFPIALRRGSASTWANANQLNSTRRPYIPHLLYCELLARSFASSCGFCYINPRLNRNKQGFFKDSPDLGTFRRTDNCIRQHGASSPCKACRCTLSRIGVPFTRFRSLQVLQPCALRDIH